MNRFSLRLMWCCGLLLVLSPASAEDLLGTVRELREQTGLQRGLCAVFGDEAAALAVEWSKGTELSFFVQLPPGESLERARRLAEEAGLLGRRMTIAEGAATHLHLADNLADAVVVREAASPNATAPRDEILRVLRPGGRAFVGSQKILKPFPDGTDDWSHPYRGPDNNPQSRDQLARAPYLTHFVAEPWYSPMPLVTVAAGGRLFKAFGHVAIKEREWPLLNTLVVQNAFNGTQLWQRPLSPNFMIHRNTLLATEQTLFLADDASCKLLDAATGEMRSEIVSMADDGRVWKWIALADGVLYALVGPDETPDPTVRGERRARGWPWGPPLGAGYNSKEYPWGFGRTLLAIDPQSQRVLWRHRETELLDTRAMCLAAGRIFFYSPGRFVGAVDCRTGDVLWRTAAADVLDAIGPQRFAQNPGEGFSSSSYAKCDDRAVYFAGPTRTDLAAVSARDGKLLWRVAGGGNSQLVLRSDGLYAMGIRQSVRYDYATGEVLESLGPRVNCTRATGSADSIFVRGGRDGTMRYDLVSHEQQHLCPMRPSCQDGVLVAHGHLFWGPWMCDCNLTLVGVVSLAPAGAFDFVGDPRAAERLETAADAAPAAAWEISTADWPTLRANNARTAVSLVSVPTAVQQAWSLPAASGLAATAPTAAGGSIFVGSRDGSVRAVDAETGGARWVAYTGGPIHYPPTLWRDRAFVGSGDGWVYCLEAASGRRLWRFRAAPADRVIPVYGSLSSTWPVAGGVLVEDGVAYAAAGLASFDGTHVFALDAESGRVRWHVTGGRGSDDAGRETLALTSVNGHLLLRDGRLYLAGGNMVPAAAFAAADGKCLADPHAPNSHTQFTAGGDLFAVGEQVLSGGPPLYSTRGDYRLVNLATLQTPQGDVQFAYGPHDGRVALFAAGESPRAGATPRWQATPLNHIAGVAVTPNAIVLVGERDAPQINEPPQPHVVALGLADGSPLWNQPLPAAPVPWGVLVDRAGRIVVSLQSGAVLCLAAPQ